MRSISLRVAQLLVSCCLLVASPPLVGQGSASCGVELCPDDIFGVHSESCIPCGRPVSNGDSPVTTDPLAILRAAVGQSVMGCSGERFCICDVNCDGVITVRDALPCLMRAVGQPVALECCCPVVQCGPACTSAEIFTREGSDFDAGWTGIAHNSDLIVGRSFTVRIKRECSTTTSQECEHAEDCPSGETCEPTCDCNSDVTCEVSGPTHQRKCQNNLEDCTTNADCDPAVPCMHLFGPPLPLSSGGTPVCVVSSFDGPITGTANTETGEADTSMNLRTRVFLGIAVDTPCPRCGAPDQDPVVGDAFTCTGGQNNGAACTVDGVSEDFGGTSYDCPPSLDGSISGLGLAIRLNQVTTGTTTRTAQLPCKFFGFTGNPTVPGSNPKCLDKNSASDPVCTSNADCKRCTGDIATACASNGDCTGKGFCGEAPDQPVTCGFWCNCGFCDNNPGLPCFQTSDCPQGQACQAGTGTGTQPNAPQQRANDCSGDKFICGGTANETCATTEKSSCSEDPYRTCHSDEDCETFDAGFCNFEPRPCFESRITRTGLPSPLGSYCAYESKTCTTNADCTQEGDFCAPDSSRAETVALFCLPATANSAVNSTGGITGPAAVRFNTFMQVCRCGDSIVGCDEDCDDGNNIGGDGCDDLCQHEP
jgi:hypothetical protein